MNSSSSSSLKVYYTKATLSTRLSDYANVYLLPFLCTLGMTTSAANILVTLKIKRQDHIIIYILINSILDFLLLVTQFFSVIIRCGVLCPYGYSFASKVYEIVFYSFARSAIVTAQAMFILHMTVENLKLFYKKQFCCFKMEIKNKHLLPVILAISVCINAVSNIIPREVAAFGVYYASGPTNQTVAGGGDAGEILYKRVYKPVWEKSSGLQAIITVCLIFRFLVLYTLIGIVSALVAYKFQQFLKNKKKMFKNKSKSKVILLISK
jgi:hypothetical protein